MYNNYIFDLYGTLVDISTDEYSMDLWEKVALFYSFKGAKYSALELKESFDNKIALKKASIKNTDYPDFRIEEIFNELYLDKDVVVNDSILEDTCHFFRITSCKYLKLYPGVMDLLKLLKSKNKKIYLLSNAQRIFTGYEMDYLGITEYFDDIFFSADHMMCKPDKNFFYALMHKHNLSVEDSVMIGNDSNADIHGAYNIGLPSFYLHSNLSPEINGELVSTYRLMDFNISNIAPLIIK